MRYRGTSATANHGYQLAGSASTCFCLLQRASCLYGERIVRNASFEGSAYVRAIAALYVRIGVLADAMWQWIEPYFLDRETFQPGARVGDASVTFGEWLSQLFLTVEYCGTALPRIPVTLAQEFALRLDKLPTMKRCQKVNGVQREKFSIGKAIYALFSEDWQWYSARVDDIDEEQTQFFVTYLPESEYGNSEWRRPRICPRKVAHSAASRRRQMQQQLQKQQQRRRRRRRRRRISPSLSSKTSEKTVILNDYS